METPATRARRVIGLAAGVLVLAFLAFATDGYRVPAEATLEGRVQRAIVAGVDGYVAEANVRAGDLVAAGDVMGRLDVRDLMLEARQLSGRYAQLMKEHRQGLARHDRSQVNILAARMEQTEAQRKRLEMMWEMHEVMEDFDVFVSSSGDLALTNLTGHPTVTLPYAFRSQPRCICIVGDLFGDDKVLSIAHAYQAATDWHTRHPEL